MNLEAYKKQFTENDSVGWNYIDKRIQEIYADQEPQHFGNIISSQFGGDNLLEGFSVYESNEQEAHFHLVTYGLSELFYNEEAVGKEYSKFGCEFTFRINKSQNDDFQWAINLMKNLANYVFDTGNWFEEFHFIPTNSPICLNYDTDLVGIAFIQDPEFKKIDTPHGEVKFLQLVGITQKELDFLWENPKLSQTKILLDQLKNDNPLLITDLDRK